MKNIFLFFVMCSIALMTGCGYNQTTDDKLNKQQEQLMEEANKQIGMPSIVNFQERKLAKQIFEECDRTELICYAYLMNNMTGKPVFLGKCLGYGLPYSVQFTNPVKAMRLDVQGSSTADTHTDLVPQADPNGLYMPEGLSATWVMLLDSKGVPHPTYIEADVIVSAFPLDSSVL